LIDYGNFIGAESADEIEDLAGTRETRVRARRILISREALGLIPREQKSYTRPPLGHPFLLLLLLLLPVLFAPLIGLERRAL